MYCSGKWKALKFSIENYVISLRRPSHTVCILWRNMYAIEMYNLKWIRKHKIKIKGDEVGFLNCAIPEHERTYPTGKSSHHLDTQHVVSCSGSSLLRGQQSCEDQGHGLPVSRTHGPPPLGLGHKFDLLMGESKILEDHVGSGNISGITFVKAQTATGSPGAWVDR